MGPGLIALIVIGVIVVSILLWAVGTYNGLIGLRNKVKEAFATMDVYLKQRWDMIPNLVETVKGYAKHEKETLTELAKLRNLNYDGMNNDEKIDANKKLAGNITKLFAVAESYPELKANENFMELSNSLKEVEESIANSRKYYNAVVMMYNNKIQMIPSNIIAGMFNFKAEKSFEIDEGERKNVEVKF